MSSFTFKIFVIVLIFSAEVLYILSEMLSAKYYFSPNSQITHILLKLIPLTIIGSILILVGYMLGYKTFSNIWIISAISITSILIIEPTLAFLVFKQLPTKGALIGLILGATGFFTALFIE